MNRRESARETSATAPPAPASPHRAWTSFLPPVVVAFAVAYFVVLASAWPTRPGLYMDETNFVNAALGGYPHELFVSMSVAGVPLMIMTYIGALKSALFAPVFAAFGVSPLTVRLPAIAVSAASLVVAYFLGRRLVGRWVGALLVVLMATCPTFALMSKVDWSPMVLAMLLKLTAFVVFFRFLRTGRLRWLWGLLTLFLLGIYNKQDFLWIVVAMAIGGAVAYRGRIRTIVAGRRDDVVKGCGAFAASAVFYLFAFVLPNLHQGGSSSLQDPLGHLASTWRLYVMTTGYSEVIGFFTAHAPIQPAWMGWLWVPTLVCLGVLAALRLRGQLPVEAEVPARAAAFFAVVAVVVFVEIASTRQAIGPQHAIELWPLQLLMLLCSATAVVRWDGGRWSRVAVSAAAALGVVALAGAQAVSTAQYVSLLRHPDELRPVFSLAVYRDSCFLNANPSAFDQVVSADWGPGTPLFALAAPSQRGKYRDVEFHELTALTPADARAMVQHLFGDHRIALVTTSDPQLADVTPGLRSDLPLIEEAYRADHPARRPQRLLTTSAYDITYFGPGSAVVTRDAC